MNKQILGYWDKKKIKLKERFPVFTDYDLSFPEGKEKEMIEMLGNKIGMTQQELLNIIVGL